MWFLSLLHPWLAAAGPWHVLGLGSLTRFVAVLGFCAFAAGGGDPLPDPGSPSGQKGPDPQPGTGPVGPDPRRIVAVWAHGDETRQQVMDRVRAMAERVAVTDRFPDAHVVLYAARSPHDMNMLMGVLLEPEPHSVLLDLEASIWPGDAAALGFLGFLRAGLPAEEFQYCLESAAGEYPYAPKVLEREFHRARERGALTVQQRLILHVYARGNTHEVVAERMGLKWPTYVRRVADIRRKLGLRRREDLRLVAVKRLGSG